MQGKIVSINQHRGLYCIECTDGTYSIFELLDTNDINEEDVIQGELSELGNSTLYNLSTQESFEAFIEDTGVSFQTA